MPRLGVEYDSDQKDSIVFHGPITDVHMHPRIHDVYLAQQPEYPNGKAGINEYSRYAVLGGIAMGIAMPNETARIYNPGNEDQTELIPAPITTAKDLLYAATNLSANSYIPMSINMGVDPKILNIENGYQHFTTKNIEKEFSDPLVRDLAAGLKIYCGETEGGYHIPIEYVINVAQVWHQHNQYKPVVLHAEDEDVSIILKEWPAKIPVHIAHVSSKEELEAVIIAKENGKDVTCEATPHHRYMTELTREVSGPYGCMKPTLKPEEDRKYLWDHNGYIDIYASDCAPHREIDKVGIERKGKDNPSFGVINHDMFLRADLNAIVEGHLTPEQLYERVVTNPLKRFNLPYTETLTRFNLSSVVLPQDIEAPYGCSPNLPHCKTARSEHPYPASPETPILRGQVTHLRIGRRLLVNQMALSLDGYPSYKNLIRF